LKAGTVLARAYEAGKTSPIGRFFTRGATINRITSPAHAERELKLADTSSAVATHLGFNRVTADIPAKIGFVEGGGDNAIQIVVDYEHLQSIEQFGALILGPR
jgi:hypothetical protein